MWMNHDDKNLTNKQDSRVSVHVRCVGGVLRLGGHVVIGVSCSVTPRQEQISFPSGFCSSLLYLKSDCILWSSFLICRQCLFVHREKRIFLSVYVDDIKLAEKKQNIDPMWKILNWYVQMKLAPSSKKHINLHLFWVGEKRNQTLVYTHVLYIHGDAQTQCKHDSTRTCNKRTKTTTIWRLSQQSTHCAIVRFHNMFSHCACKMKEVFLPRGTTMSVLSELNIQSTGHWTLSTPCEAIDFAFHHFDVQGTTQKTVNAIWSHRNAVSQRCMASHHPSFLSSLFNWQKKLRNNAFCVHHVSLDVSLLDAAMRHAPCFGQCCSRQQLYGECFLSSACFVITRDWGFMFAFARILFQAPLDGPSSPPIDTKGPHAPLTACVKPRDRVSPKAHMQQEMVISHALPTSRRTLSVVGTLRNGNLDEQSAIICPSILLFSVWVSSMFDGPSRVGPLHKRPGHSSEGSNG